MPVMFIVMPVPKFPSGLQEGGKSHSVTVWYLQAMQLKIRDSHYLTGKVAKGYLNVREWMEVVENDKVVPSLLLLSREKNPDRKKQNKTKQNYKLIFVWFTNQKTVPKAGYQ